MKKAPHTAEELRHALNYSSETGIFTWANIDAAALREKGEA